MTITAKLLLLTVSISIASTAFAKNPYHNDPHPFRAYYFGYGLTNPGIGFGPEFTLSWTKMERSKCTHGVRVSDRQFLLAPQLGLFQNEAATFSAYANLELTYRVTFHGGLTFELFGAGGYAMMLQSPEPVVSPDENGSAKSVNQSQTNEAKSGFMPEAGIGLGYDLQKINGRDIPLAFNIRGLATGVAPTGTESLVPALQAGLIYSF